MCQDICQETGGRHEKQDKIQLSAGKMEEYCIAL